MSDPALVPSLCPIDRLAPGLYPAQLSYHRTPVPCCAGLSAHPPTVLCHYSEHTPALECSACGGHNNVILAALRQPLDGGRGKRSGEGKRE